MESFLKETLSYLPQNDLKIIEKAHFYAECAHAYQVRASGENYFSHCIMVAKNLAELKIDAATISAALLHDVLEDTLATEQELIKEFGEEIVNLVKGVTKLSKYKFDDEITAQAENWRKMLLAVVKDIRVIIIKLADRLHNMRTLSFLPVEKQKIIASESLNLYAPFAHRLGIYKWKSEIEDVAFKTLQPEQYNFIRTQWQKRDESNLENLISVENQIKNKIVELKIPFRITARPKNLYGIYKKMQRQNKPFTEIQDLFGLRIITDTVENCYAILGMINANFNLLDGSFTDYINLPKENMYQSLHLTVVSNSNAIVEIQIRTEEMNQRCEYGVAAHWRYKRKVESCEKDDNKNKHTESNLDWLKQFLEYQKEHNEPGEFLKSLRTECSFEQIFVFTPKRKVIKLPLGATALDFAYAVHSDIGDSFMGAKINFKMGTIDTELKTGDICEILTRKNSRPTSGWLEFAITPHARARIRKFLKEQIKKH
ncbi:MAG: RelA/SpoT family protein [Elusimicrobiota bacterium]|jgi:GTP pyrophosphokinase|nr:RelA/SpoT family protein [Elusimicrobiota bacterium]